MFIIQIDFLCSRYLQFLYLAVNSRMENIKEAGKLFDGIFGHV